MLLYKRLLSNAEAEQAQASFIKKIKMSFPLTLEILLAKTWKDVKDTIKPYKQPDNILRDLVYQPFYGAGNMLLGGFDILLSPFLLIGSIFAIPSSMLPKEEYNAIYDAEEIDDEEVHAKYDNLVTFFRDAIVRRDNEKQQAKLDSKQLTNASKSR